MTQQTPSGRAAQQQFGRQAHLYAQSTAHRSGEGLDVLTQYMAMGSPHALSVDVGAGAGFTAFAASPYASHVLATDITPQMLDQTRRQARERGIANLGVMLTQAESLPFRDASVDMVTCRQAAHHFHNLPAALAEARRVLKPGGAFLFTDPVSPETDGEDRWLNNVEVRRDPSHVRDLRISEWRLLLAEAGLAVTHTSMARVYHEFNDWVRRAATPQQNIEPLRRDLLQAAPSVVEAFGIRHEDDTFYFYWDVLVARAVRQ
ncbi:MAG: class I SAM-dependent methyltransferase [Chloroflexi bacterium]|nr:class I SAM-dependent methyltransferase [Chloroflexota bacterium]